MTVKEVYQLVKPDVKRMSKPLDIYLILTDKKNIATEKKYS